MSIDGFSHLDLACEIRACVCYTPPVSYMLGSKCSSSYPLSDGFYNIGHLYEVSGTLILLFKFPEIIQY